MNGGLPGLQTGWLGRTWEHFEEIDSTNDACKRAADRLPHGAVITASLQTAGKGRLGKQWREQPDQGLALSFLLRGAAVEDMGRIPLLAGLAVCRALEAFCGISCGLKWSNDVLWLGGREEESPKKLCGILCESRIARQENIAIVGIGVNLLQNQDFFDRLGLVYASSLFLATGRQWRGPSLAGAILEHFEPLWEQYRAEGFEPLRLAYKERCVTLGREIRVIASGEATRGEAVDIADDGSLLCRVDGEVRPVSAGEASVRGIYGYQ